MESSGSGIVVQEARHEYTPEEVALLMRRRIFIRLKWFAIGGVIVATLIASEVFHIGFPALPVYLICVALALYNFFLIYQARHLQKEKSGLVIQKARTFGYINIYFDLIALTILLHFTGGIENPFIFYFVFHVIIAGVVQPKRTVYVMATAIVAMVILLASLEYSGVIPHINLRGFVEPDLYRQESYIVAVLLSLTTILYATAYMVTGIFGELSGSQQQVLELRERLLKERTGQLAQASSEISKLEEEKNRFLRFLGIAAHDMKAPLAAIQSYFEVMLGGFAGELDEKQRNMIERSSKRVKELLTLISDLLDIPRIETGQIIQEMKEVSLSQVIENAVDELGEMAKQKNLKLEVDVPPNSCSVYGSAFRLQQVIVNLVSNAINYTAEGSVTIRARDAADTIRVEVIDTGIGIPPQDLPRMFEDFFRAGNVAGKQGTGLGLSIAKRIVNAHKGEICVESPYHETGRGSKFTITLPKMSGVREAQK